MAEFDPTDFGQLPSQKWHARLRSSTASVGIDIPYFRTHAIQAGAETVIDGRRLVNSASYDYLGLNGHPETAKAAIRAIEDFGTSVSASRLIAGERAFHTDLETRLAMLYGVDDALSFVSGHATNVTTIGHILGSPDLLVHDASIHNSVIMGARLSRATIVKFAHNDLHDLEAVLAEHRPRHRRCIIAVEGLYSMEGDIAELPRLIALKRRHRSWLMVDEAHALGVLGASGRGSAEHHGIAGTDIDIWMGTLSKALASSGGYIAGNASLIDYLKHSAPGFVFSVGLSPPASAAAAAALDLLLRQPDLTRRLVANTKRLKEGVERLGLDTGSSFGAAIVPLHVGDSLRAMIWAEHLFRAGINVLPIVFPAVSFDGALLRFFVSASHTDAQIDRTLEAIGNSLAEMAARDLGKAS